MEDKSLADAWERGSPYEQYIGRWSRLVAPLFLAWLNIPSGRRWLDAGCGTGALCAAILEHCSPASVTGVDPSEGFLKTAAQNLMGRAELYPGSATAIPLKDLSVDVVVSGLMLNFVPDPHAALIEMTRVTAPDGVIAAYVWDYSGKMELIRHFWDAAVALDPAAAALDEGIRFPMCRPEALKKLFEGAGLQEIEVKPVEIQTPFFTFENYWQPFLGGQGPAPAYAMSLNETARARLKEHIHRRLPIATDGSIVLTARAWAIRATIPK